MLRNASATLATVVLAALTTVIIAGSIPSAVEAAAIQIVDSNGQLTGARNVNVNGTLYDVTFVDGTCIDLFSGCDEQSDFVFSTPAEAQAAILALFDQVFLDTPLGAFDSSPDLTAGCESALGCGTFIPYALEQFQFGTLFWSAFLENTSAIDDGSGVLFALGPDFFDRSLDTRSNFAAFTPVTSIPEPATLALFGLGLIGLAATRRRARK